MAVLFGIPPNSVIFSCQPALQLYLRSCLATSVYHIEVRPGVRFRFLPSRALTCHLGAPYRQYRSEHVYLRESPTQFRVDHHIDM